MNTQVDKAAYENAILSYLQDKYSEEFVINAMFQEFSGDTGVCVRATCVSEKYADEFTVRCYLDATVTPQTLQINGQKHAVEDYYAEVLCQNRLMQEIPEWAPEGCIVKCRVDFYGRQPTEDEYAEGLEACLRNKALRAYIKIYILTNGSSEAQEIYSTTENLVKQYAPDTGYIYFAVCENFDAAYVEQVFADNQHDFGNFLVQKEFADQVWFTLYKTEGGLQDRKAVKG